MSRKNCISGQQRRRAHHRHQISNNLWFGFEYSTYDIHSNPSRPYDEPCSLRVNFWTEMPRGRASLGAQTMPDNCQFLQELLFSY
jgi:hypothetical protein